MAELSTEVEKQKREQLLPLVVEILPGQAGEGLLEVFEAGSYETKKLADLCQQMLARHDWSIEERQILDDIQRQLQGGKLLAKGQEYACSGPGLCPAGGIGRRGTIFLYSGPGHQAAGGGQPI